jgi:hypothetical protein
MERIIYNSKVKLFILLYSNIMERIIYNSKVKVFILLYIIYNTLHDINVQKNE